jgi:hypothetical protein
LGCGSAPAGRLPQSSGWSLKERWRQTTPATETTDLSGNPARPPTPRAGSPQTREKGRRSWSWLGRAVGHPPFSADREYRSWLLDRALHVSLF